MKPVVREDILDHVTYGGQRDAIRASAMQAKDLRRVHVGPHLTFLFENPETVRYQVLEMVRAEQIVREADIRHELETYNALLGGPGDLGCTMFIEIEDEKARPGLLRAWRNLPGQVFLLLADGRVVPARWDDFQMDEDRLSSVQFLRFPLGEGEPVGIRVTLPALSQETRFDPATREALAGDLSA
ncbi:MAG: DUF3501 family protein [Geothrix sp.]|nr:DUF3501 family protein [Geothrix sp.]